MPQTVRLQGGENEAGVISSNEIINGKAYIIVQCSDQWTWRPGQVVFRAEDYLCSPNDNLTAEASYDGLMVRPLRPGERIVIEEQ